MTGDATKALEKCQKLVGDTKAAMEADKKGEKKSFFSKIVDRVANKSSSELQEKTITALGEYKSAVDAANKVIQRVRIVDAPRLKRSFQDLEVRVRHQ